MKASNFSLSAYLSRIGFEGEASCDLVTLERIVRRQLVSIPFENTEVQVGRIPSMIPEDIVEKILTHGRGGYCYEINGLFAMALDALEFSWYFVAARPMFYPVRRPKTHMIVVVQLDGASYLCDTGFGGYALRAPLLLKEGEVVQDGDLFRLEMIDSEYVLSVLVQGVWQQQYGFTLQAQEWIDFSLANYFNATHPDTIFTQKKLAIMQTPTGRKILVDNELKLIENGEIDYRTIDYDQGLKEYFGITWERGEG